MFSTTDTIVAIATPPGRGGIGVVRLSGDRALAISECLTTHRGRLSPRHATFTTITDPSGGLGIDQAVVTFFPSPGSYTGEDVVELSAHGSPVVLRGILQRAIANGARLAEPGEFTLRAYLHGRIDLMQAEAVADLIDAVTPLQARAAFDQLQGTLSQVIAGIDASLFELVARLEASVDFPEEGYHFADPTELTTTLDALIDRVNALLADAARGRMIREGLQVAIVGQPNVGKSSLFNAFAGAARAIVTDSPGTTRDLVTETVDLDGIRVTFVDTAGLRDATDSAETEGVVRARRAAAAADLTLVVLDRSAPLANERIEGELEDQIVRSRVLRVANKCDLPGAWHDNSVVEVSATTGAGLDVLRAEILKCLDVEPRMDRPDITNIRHVDLVARARDALVRARAAMSDGQVLSEEFVLADLQDARMAFEEVTGRRTPDDVLAHIFERFCIGK